jgi:putative transcriptional regulator
VPAAWLPRLFLALAALLLPAPLLNAALPKHNPAQTPHASTLAGQFLIASPQMGDPRFRRTVILIVRHDKLGAMGIVINRPMGEQPLKRLLEGVGEKGADVEGSVRLFAGGPVQPEKGFVVHTDDYRRKGTTVVNERLAVTSTREVLLDIGRKRGPQKALVAFGYAGWSPGQLEGELAADAWLVVPAEVELVFDEPREKVWDLAMAKRPGGP